METNTIRVFFDELGYPFKDNELSVRYPVIGSAFLGASNTTKIRFYYSRLGNDSETYGALTKLPNGKQGFRVLTLDEDEYGKYGELSLSSWYTQAKGDVFISMCILSGSFELSDEDDIWELVGENTTTVCGAIKLAINYAPVGDSPDYTDEYETYQDILGFLGQKLNITSGIISVNAYTDINTSAYENGQVFYVKATRTFYILSSGNLYPMQDYLSFTSSDSSGTLTSTQLGILNMHNNYVIFNGELYSLIGDNWYQKIEIEYDEHYDYTTFALLHFNMLNGAWSYNSYDIEFETNHTVILSSASGTLSQSNYDKLDHYPSYIKLGQGSSYDLCIHYKDDINYLYFKPIRQHTLEEATNKLQSYDYDIKIAKSNRSVQATSYVKYVYSAEQSDTKFGTSLDLTIDSNYDLVVKLLNANGQVISQDDIDLPLESIVVSATYYDTYTYEGTTYNNVLVIVLATTDVPTIIPLGDLVSGLVSSDDLATALANYYTKTQTDTLLSGKQDTLTFDDTPTTSSNNPVKSGGIKTYVDSELNGKIDFIVLDYEYNDETVKDLVDTIPSDKKCAFVQIRDRSTPFVIYYECFIRVVARSGGYYDIYATDLNGKYQWNALNIYQDSYWQNIFVVSNRVSIANSNDLQDIREIAEGKCKIYILSYADAYSTVSADLQANPSKTIVDESGNDITSDFLTDTDSAYSDYVINAQFNSQNDYIGTGLTSPTYCYIIIKKIIDNQLDLSGDYILCKVDFTTPENTKIKVGDLLLVVETSIPDRWFSNISDTQLFYKLETGAANGYAKNEDLIPSANNTYDIGSSSYTFKNGYFAGKLFVGNNEYLSTDSDGELSIYTSVTNRLVKFAGSGTIFSQRINVSNDNSIDIGRSGGRWRNIYLSGGINPNTNGYKLTIPDTTSWTSNKEIMTIEEKNGINTYFLKQSFAINSHVSVNKIVMIDLGELTWTLYNSTNKIFKSNTNFIVDDTNGGAKIKLLCPKYQENQGAYASSSSLQDLQICFNNIGNSWYIMVRDTNFDNANDFKTAMNGVMLCYEGA